MFRAHAGKFATRITGKHIRMVNIIFSKTLTQDNIVLRHKLQSHKLEVAWWDKPERESIKRKNPKN